MKAIVSEKGQVTIPKQLRNSLGIRAGQVLEFLEENGRLVATKVQSANPFESMYGIVKFDRAVDDVMRELRDPE